jgi:circadian clock protein KaiC
VSTPPFDATSKIPSQGPLLPTGVPQLDQVLGGGLPQGALAIILGPPGSGKTTLASQIAFAAAGRGQQALLLTALSEPTTKLLDHLRSYSFFVPDLVGSGVQIFSLQQFLAQGKPATAQEIVAAVHQTRANMIILDGFQGMRGMETDFMTTRQLLYDLGTRLSLLGTTTLITTEADPRDPALFPEMTTGDALIGLYFTLQGARALRSMEVLKVRGRAPLLGRHSMMLSAEGVHIFPRLESWSKRATFEEWRGDSGHLDVRDRATCGMPELDALLGGGLTRNTSTLLTGSLGTGKTLLALHFALAGVNNGEPVLYLGFRETGEQLVQKADAFAMGAQLRKALASGGGLTLQRWEPVELDPDQVATRLLTAIERTGARRMVIDSIAELERAVSENNGRERTSNYMAALLAALRERGVTLLAIKETSKGAETQLDFSVNALAILAENVLLTQQLAYRGKLHRVLSILKMRFSDHDYTLREFVVVSPEGMRVLTADESGEEVLAGLAEAQTGSRMINPSPLQREG